MRAVVVEVFATWVEDGVEYMLQGQGEDAEAAAKRCMVQWQRVTT